MTLTIGKRAALFALIAGTALVAGIGAVAHEPGAGFAFHSHMTMSNEDIAAHADKFLQHVYVEVNATDAQKAQIDPLVRQAVTDLLPMHAGVRDFHAQALALLNDAEVSQSAQVLATKLQSEPDPVGPRGHAAAQRLVRLLELLRRAERSQAGGEVGERGLREVRVGVGREQPAIDPAVLQVLEHRPGLRERLTGAGVAAG